MCVTHDPRTTYETDASCAHLRFCSTQEGLIVSTKSRRGRGKNSRLRAFGPLVRGARRDRLHCPACPRVATCPTLPAVRGHPQINVPLRSLRVALVPRDRDHQPPLSRHLTNLHALTTCDPEFRLCGATSLRPIWCYQSSQSAANLRCLTARAR